jgi:hypothetical protein
MPTATKQTTTPTIAGAIRQEAVDPLLEHYRQYRAVEDAGALVNARHTVLRAALVERYGECLGNVPAVELWESDPDYAEMHHAGAESDRITDEELIPVTNSIIETPATTLSGLLVKAQVALDLFPSNDADSQYHEDAALAVLKDAVRVLAGSVRA